MLLSRQNAYFYKIDVFAYGVVFHRKLRPKTLHLEVKNALKSLKNTPNVEIGWIGWASGFLMRKMVHRMATEGGGTVADFPSTL